jgi:hypothetical protein
VGGDYKLSPRELELQQLRIEGRKAKQRRLTNKAPLLNELRASMAEAKPKKGKRRGKKSVPRSRHTETP